MAWSKTGQPPSTPVLIVGQDQAGRRLDEVCAALLPRLSLRARRRLIGLGGVLASGRVRHAGYKARPGEEIELASAHGDYPEGTQSPWPGPQLIEAGPDYAAFFKPAGLDSEGLAGKPGPTLAQAAHFLLPGAQPGQLKLLTRLDRPTSGLVLAGRSQEAAARFRRSEDQGLAVKMYLALVLGDLSEELTVTNALDTAKRTKTRVLDHPGPALRHTRVWPLPFAAGPGRTLVAAMIRKGARHQIRAHLSSIGHPVAGDALYGPGLEGGGLYLHHARLIFPGNIFVCQAKWTEFLSVMPDIMVELARLSKTFQPERGAILQI